MLVDEEERQRRHAARDIANYFAQNFGPDSPLGKAEARVREGLHPFDEGTLTPAQQSDLLFCAKEALGGGADKKGRVGIERFKAEVPAVMKLTDKDRARQAALEEEDEEIEQLAEKPSTRVRPLAASLAVELSKPNEGRTVRGEFKEPSAEDSVGPVGKFRVHLHGFLRQYSLGGTQLADVFTAMELKMVQTKKQIKEGKPPKDYTRNATDGLIDRFMEGGPMTSMRRVFGNIPLFCAKARELGHPVSAESEEQFREAYKAADAAAKDAPVTRASRVPQHYGGRAR